MSLATLSLDFSSLLISVRIGRDFSFRVGLMPVSPTPAGLTVFLSCRHGSHLAIEPALLTSYNVGQCDLYLRNYNIGMCLVWSFGYSVVFVS